MSRLEWGNSCFKKARPAMLACVLGLGLLATWAPASMAETHCQKLVRQGSAALKPSAVIVRKYQGGPDAILVWDLPSNSPRKAFEGWCVEKRHVASENKREECYPHIGVNVARFNSCVGYQDCPTGKFTFRVKLENKCGLAEPWSDPVGFKFSG